MSADFAVPVYDSRMRITQPSLALLVLAMTISLPASAADLATKATAVVNAIAQGKSAEAAKSFDATMSTALPPDKLAATWAQVEAQAGAFEGTGATRQENLGAYTAVFVRCRFAAAELDAKVVYDKAGKIAGLFFVPPSEPAAPWSLPPYADAATFREIDVTVGKDWPLAAKLTLPANVKGKVAAVVLVHGSGPHDLDETIGPNKPFQDLATGLASRGIAVLRYDKRTKTHGARLAKEVPAFTLDHETIDDAVAALELLATRPEIDASRLYVAGHSLGGTAAPRIAERSKKAAGIVVLAGSTRALGDLVVDQLAYLGADAAQLAGAEAFRKAASSPTLKATDSLDLLGAKLPGSYLLDYRTYDPAKTAAALPGRVLVLQGGRDYQVTVAKDFEGWKRGLAGKKNATFRVFDSLNHLFQAGEGPSKPAEYERGGHVDAGVVEALAVWIEKER